MSTIKDIAKAAKISPSTVSIVLNGKAEERKISKETQNRIWEVARGLNYQPNIAAKQLKVTSDDSSVTIAVFWTTDFRAPLLIRFLNGLQEYISSCKKRIDIFIRQYHNDELYNTLTPQVLNMFHGAIICNASVKDMEFLEHANFSKPIVLYNRISDKFSCASIDNSVVGKLAAEAFIRNHHKNVAILSSESAFTGMDARVKSFQTEITNHNMNLITNICVPNSISGGYNGTTTIIEHSSVMPDCVFCVSDAISIGALKAFHEHRIHIPEDIELISIGNGDLEMEEFTIPSLSVVEIPIEKMASTCLKLLLKQIPFNNAAVEHIIIPVQYQSRESCLTS